MSEDKPIQGLQQFPAAAGPVAPSPPQAPLAARLAGWVLLGLLAAIAIWIVDRKADKAQPGRPYPRQALTVHAGAAGDSAPPVAGPR